MNRFVISPAERPPITNLGTVSSLPERLGVDIAWEGREGMAGAQRKTYMDLIASVRDGRLGRELQQMETLKYRFLILEGVPAWDQSGNFQSSHIQWTMRQQFGVELSIQSSNCFILRSRSALETCSTCEYLFDWTQKERSVSSLLQRQSVPTNGWGKIDNRTMALHVWTGVPGLGLELAGRIYDKGLRLLRCGVTKEELLSVDGIGPKKAAQILKALSGDEG